MHYLRKALLLPKFLVNLLRELSMNIFENVKKLNLPLGKYLVLGGGVLAAHGLRNYHDIDILTTESIFEELSKNHYWGKYKLKSGKIVLKRGYI